MTGAGLEPRQLLSWIDSFCEYAEVRGCAQLWSKWSAISVLAGALERRVWIRTAKGEFYPNIYCIIVGPPGLGKSIALNLAELFLRPIENKPHAPGIFLAPSTVSAASLLDSLSESHRKIVRPADNPPITEFNYFTVFASELGIFLPDYEPRFITRLIKFYDGEHFEERLRSRENKQIIIERGQMTLFGATTPSYLNGFLPEGAWDQGFTSRTIFVYNGERIHSAVWPEETQHDRFEKLFLALIHDIKQIAKLFGKMEWDDSAMDAITQWNNHDLPPVPRHRKLEHYNSRRLGHLLKLCMIASVSRSNDLHITLVDYQTALGWLLEAEAVMPDIFSAMGGIAGDSEAIEQAWEMLMKHFLKTNKAVPKHILVNFLKDRVPASSIQKVIETMEGAEIVKFTAEGYMPSARH